MNISEKVGRLSRDYARFFSFLAKSLRSSIDNRWFTLMSSTTYSALAFLKIFVNGIIPSTNSNGDRISPCNK